MDADANRLRADGASAIYVGIDDHVAGVLAIADSIKDTTPAAIKALRDEGIEVVMLTGDNHVTAAAVARTLGIDRVEADVLPEHKSTSSPSCAAKAESWPWPATASTTYPP